MDRTPVVTCREGCWSLASNRRCGIWRSPRCRGVDDPGTRRRRNRLLAGTSGAGARHWLTRGSPARSLGCDGSCVAACRGVCHSRQPRVPASPGESWISPRRARARVSSLRRAALRRSSLLASPKRLGIGHAGWQARGRIADDAVARVRAMNCPRSGGLCLLAPLTLARASDKTTRPRDHGHSASVCSCPPRTLGGCGFVSLLAEPQRWPSLARGRSLDMTVTMRSLRQLVATHNNGFEVPER